MAQIKVGDIHGLYTVFVGLINGEGYNQGVAGSGITEETLVSPYRLRYPKDASIPLSDRTVINFQGGDVWTGSYVYGIADMGSGSLVSSTAEIPLITLLTGSGYDQTLNTLSTYYTENIMKSTPDQAWMMSVHRIQSKEAGTKGKNAYWSMIMPRGWILPKGNSGQTFQNGGQYEMTIVPTVGERMPWGPLFSTTELDLENNETPIFYVITDYPPAVVGWQPASGDATTSIVLPYDLAGVAADYTTPDSANQRLQVYIDGVQTDADSINFTTRTVVVSPISPATTFDGTEYIGIFWETNNYKTT